MINNKNVLYIVSTILFFNITIETQSQNLKSPYSNGNKFKVLSYVYTDLDDNVLDRNNNIKQTTFIIDPIKKLFTVKMSNIYSEYYFYNKVQRITKNGETKDVYAIYKSYNTQKVGVKLTDVLILVVNANTNELKNYELYFGNKGFINFNLAAVK